MMWNHIQLLNTFLVWSMTLLSIDTECALCTEYMCNCVHKYNGDHLFDDSRWISYFLILNVSTLSFPSSRQFISVRLCACVFSTFYANNFCAQFDVVVVVDLMINVLGALHFPATHNEKYAFYLLAHVCVCVLYCCNDSNVGNENGSGHSKWKKHPIRYYCHSFFLSHFVLFIHFNAANVQMKPVFRRLRNITSDVVWIFRANWVLFTFFFFFGMLFSNCSWSNEPHTNRANLPKPDFVVVFFFSFPSSVVFKLISLYRFTVMRCLIFSDGRARDGYWPKNREFF